MDKRYSYWNIKKLKNDDKESEEFSCMNRHQFYNYIEENYDISSEAGRLIDNILCFVEENYTEENEQYSVLCDLLGGTIGLTDNELKKFTCKGIKL